ncbi:fimbrial protein [Pseudomonas otitidis]|uniref:Fimbrial protein n=1 Tax=Metapseudomonas otitidis TaxID=319939 RepID=A0ABU3XZA6_9GAMM|nr:fimbrial protein [Pseudomonas otitidis]MDV3443195.1 fimbrial protein [Pseudomonas otitidis]MDV3443204.1 fimbrial protein [Pseudomonas otitidis]WMR35166.1 fimbrial protein [Pseudomonas otitidis]
MIKPYRLLMYLFMAALLPVTGLLSPHALACSLKRDQSTNFTFPTPLNVPRDLPIGGVIYDTHGWIGSGDAYVDCMGLFQHYIGTGFISGPSEVTVPGKTDVYATNLAGVGIRVAWSNSVNTPAHMEGGEMMRSARRRTPIPRNHYAPAQRWWIQLIKTGKINSGTLSMNSVRIYYDDALTNQLNFVSSQVVFQTRGCVASGATQLVTLQQSHIGQFKGVGSTARPRTFSLDLDCDEGVKASYRIDGLPATESVLKNVTGSPELASGIGVQLLQSDGVQPFLLGKKYVLGTADRPNSDMKIELQARYYQFQEQIRPGLIMTTATVTLYYE